jgi:hypothetical protein
MLKKVHAVLAKYPYNGLINEWNVDDFYTLLEFIQHHPRWQNKVDRIAYFRAKDMLYHTGIMVVDIDGNCDEMAANSRGFDKEDHLQARRNKRPLIEKQSSILVKRCDRCSADDNAEFHLMLVDRLVLCSRCHIKHHKRLKELQPNYTP